MGIHQECKRIEERLEELQYELEELLADGFTEEDSEVIEIRDAISNCETRIDDLCELYMEMQKGDYQ